MRADQTLRLAAALLPVIAAFALGVYGLAAPSVRGDEAFSFHLASQRLPEILASLRASEIHPPLYYVMLHLWLRAVGSTDFALRYLSVIFFVPLAALVYRIVEDSVAGIQRDEAAFGEPGAEAPTTNPSVQRGPNPFNPLPESVDSSFPDASAPRFPYTRSPHIPALLAAILVATNPFLLWHGQDARMYTMATAFGLLATWATLTLTRRATGTSSWSGVPGPWLEKLRTAASSQKPETRNQKPETTDLVLYSAGATLAIFTHYAAVFLVLALNAVALASLRGRRLGIWLAVQAGIAALYLPWLVGVRELLLGHTKDWIAPTGPIEMARRTVVAFGVGSAVDPALGGWLALPFGVGLSLGAIGLIRRADGRRLLAVLALPIVLMSAVSIVRPMFDERYVVFIAPLAVAAVAIGLAPVAGRSAVGSGRSPVSGRQSAVSGVAAVAVRLASVAGSERFRSAGACPPPVLAPTEEAGDKPRRSVRIAGLRSAGAARTALRVLVAGATIVALGGYYADPRYAKSPEWRDLGRTVVERRQEGDLLLLTYPDPAPAFYVRDAVPRLLLPASFPLDPADTADHLAALTARRVWLVPVRAPNWDADGYVEQWLDARWKLIDQLRFRGPQLRLYLAPATALAVLPPREPVSFDGRIALVGAEVLPARPIQPGETLELSLYFRALGPAGQSYTVYNHLLDSGGTLRGQADGVPVRSMYPTDRWRPGEIVLDRYTIRVAADAPPGPYVIRTGLYDPKSGRRLPVLDVAGNPAADGVTIPGIRIAVAAR